MRIMTLAEVCEINPRKAINLPAESEISFIPMEAVSVYGEIDTSRSIPVEKVKNYTVFCEGDILFAKITPCMENGKGAIAVDLKNGYGAGSTEFIVLRPDTGIVLPQWVYLFLSQKSFRLNCQQNMTGSAGQKRVPAKYLAKCKIPVPSITEQERILSRIEELFSQLDKGVETLQAIKKQLIKYRRAVIKSELEKEKPNIIWNDTCISVVCDCLDNKRKPVKKDKRSSGEGKYPYYGANGQTGTIDDYLFDEELVLVVEDETFVGRIKPFSYVISGKSWVNNHAHILRGKAGKMNNHYLNYLLSYYPFLPMTTGTTGRKKLTKAALLSAHIHICDYEHQKEVVEQIDAKLSVCDEIENTIDVALQQTEAMRQSVLKQAFEGR